VLMSVVNETVSDDEYSMHSANLIVFRTELSSSDPDYCILTNISTVFASICDLHDTIHVLHLLHLQYTGSDVLPRVHTMCSPSLINRDDNAY